MTIQFRRNQLIGRNNNFLDLYYKEISTSNTPATHPVVIAVCSSVLGIEKEKAAMMLLYGFTVSTIGAALRLGLVDHIQSQQILHKLKPNITSTIEKFMSIPLENMWQFAPQYDLIQMTHEQKFSKMFIT